MAVLKLARYQLLRAEDRSVAEAVMHEHAAYVRREHADVTWTAYRDARAPTQYIAMVRAETPAADARYAAAAGLEAFHLALAALLARPAEVATYELVTSSDLARRARKR